MTIPCPRPLRVGPGEAWGRSEKLDAPQRLAMRLVLPAVSPFPVGRKAEPVPEPGRARYFP